MIKDKNNFPVLYWIGGSAAICPKCGNGNAMLDTFEPGIGDQWIQGFKCRDCGFKVSENKQTSVTIMMDVEARNYTGNAAKGLEVPIEVVLAPFDNAMGRPDIDPLMIFLAICPTPDTW
jgi:predicted nucleic-acid-binding Zn-ribbon protein